MRPTIALAIALLLLAVSCKPYKELKPEPDIIPVEGQYLELLNDDENFALKEGKKYFMKFPATASSNFYLVLRSETLGSLSTAFTRQFDYDKTPIVPVPNESEEANTAAYRMDGSVPVYFWVIENVPTDTRLALDYRYVPIWRYRFETKYAEFQLTLSQNSASRETYERLGNGVAPESVDPQARLEELSLKTDRLKAVQGELLEIEAIFPADIKNQGDKAYRDYLAFRDELEAELDFHERYREMLSVLQTERATRGDASAFARALPEFLAFFEHRNRHPRNVVEAIQGVLARRLPELTDHFRRTLEGKRDTAPVDLPVDAARDLYDACNVPPARDFTNLANFIDLYNRNAEAIAAVDDAIAAIRADIRQAGSWPSDGFYADIQSRANRLPTPTTIDPALFGSYGSLATVTALNQEARSASARVNRFREQVSRAAGLVPQINRLRQQNDYPEIVSLLQNNRDLDFLLAQYSDIDERSLNQQATAIRQAMEAGNWALAENRLRQLVQDQNFINPDAVAVRKRQITTEAENALVEGINAASRDRLNAFIERNKTTYRDVDSLYASSAFEPVHVMTYSSGGQQMLQRQNQKIREYLDGFKLDRFPRMAIEALYRDFVRDIRSDGVAKAKAIITHGRYYKGSDRQTRNLIAEVDPQVPKTLREATSYRKLYVVPVNDTQQASNEYVFKIDIQIPSDARFPVWDINLKIPREVASGAEQRSWYDRMTLNGSVLKNEGRFTITAPTASNDYECQITPLQVEKSGANILEVRFKHDAFKVLEVSAMGQRPIIKKN